MAKKTLLNTKESNECIGVPKPTFYGAIVTIFTLGIAFVISTNVRLTALEKDGENYKRERKEDSENKKMSDMKIDQILDKIGGIEKILILKADRKFQN